MSEKWKKKMGVYQKEKENTSKFQKDGDIFDTFKSWKRIYFISPLKGKSQS